MFDFISPHNEGFWSLKEFADKTDAWHFSKYLMLLSFVIGYVGNKKKWFEYAQIIFWSGIIWSIVHGFFYSYIAKELLN